MEDGSVVPRTAGTPQGGVISPLLANLFLHYAFDAWMSRTYPHIPFEKYADDAICHCKRASGAIDRSPGEVLKPVGILGVALLTGGGHLGEAARGHGRTLPKRRAEAPTPTRRDRVAFIEAGRAVRA